MGECQAAGDTARAGVLVQVGEVDGWECRGVGATSEKFQQKIQTLVPYQAGSEVEWPYREGIKRGEVKLEVAGVAWSHGQ